MVERRDGRYMAEAGIVNLKKIADVIIHVLFVYMEEKLKHQVDEGEGRKWGLIYSKIRKDEH